MPSVNSATATNIVTIASIVKATVSISRGDVVDRYLRGRRAGLVTYPSCLRISAREPYWSDGSVSRHPAMLALITNSIGEPISVHRTYLAADGGKADLPVQRKAVSSFGQGPTIRLAPVAPTMGIAEGIETALSAKKLFGVPTWSVLSDYGMVIRAAARSKTSDHLRRSR